MGASLVSSKMNANYWVKKAAKAMKMAQSHASQMQIRSYRLGKKASQADKVATTRESKAALLQAKYLKSLGNMKANTQLHSQAKMAQRLAATSRTTATDLQGKASKLATQAQR